MSEELDVDNLPDIDQAEISDQELVKSIDYTRPLKDYATAQDIANFLKGRREVKEIDLSSLSKHGRVIQDDMEVYLQDPAYNSGTLKETLKSPLHLYFERESGWKQQLEKVQKEKSYFSLGTFIHSCLLEPDKFNTVTVEPEASRSTTEGINTLISFWEDKIILRGGIINGRHEDGQTVIETAKYYVEDSGRSLDKIDGKRWYYDTLKEMSGLQAIAADQKIIIDAVKFNFNRYGGGILPELMRGVKTEVSMYYTDPVTGLDVRVRLDGLQLAENIGHNTVISVKSTACENLSHFYYHSAKLCYELSEGMYLDVAEAVTGRPFTCTIMLMVQTVPPFGVAALVWNAEDLEIGKYKYRQALQIVSDCESTGKYPGYDIHAESGNLGFIDMKQPEWNAKELFPTDIDD
jgi:hypothetical protein